MAKLSHKINQRSPWKAISGETHLEEYASDAKALTSLQSRKPSPSLSACAIKLNASSLDCAGFFGSEKTLGKFSFIPLFCVQSFRYLHTQVCDQFSSVYFTISVVIHDFFEYLFSVSYFIFIKV